MVLFLNVPVVLMAKINSPSVIPNISAKVFDNLRDKLSGKELDAMMSASDHRRAEITHNTLWDKVPASAWKNVK